VASLGHVAVGCAAGRLAAETTPEVSPAAAMIGLSALSLLPDLDGIAFALGIPYGAPFPHRGASHSLLVASAVGLAVGLFARFRRLPSVETGLLVAAVVASHGILDAMTDGGRGVALLWPFSDVRLFFPWRPIPVAPIGLGFLSARGLRVAAAELAGFLPLWAYAFWPRTPRGQT
jgi:inner membrane protein